MKMDKAPATGCYKCGRPGHWSRDCPSSAPTSTPNSNSNSNSNHDPSPNPNPNRTNLNSSSYPFKSGTATGSGGGAAPKAKKVSAPKSRPKLTPELFLSDDGLGYVLRHFPRAFKYRGRGHEVKDLGNLIGFYREWHSSLLPYYSFDQFVHKVEQVATTRRVKMSLRELRERVASGGDPGKLHEPPVEQAVSNDQQEPLDPEGPSHHEGGLSSGSHEHDADDMQEDMLNEIYEKATQEPSETLQSDMATARISTTGSFQKEITNQVPNNEASEASKNQMTDEQRARMEASRLKALEKAAARRRQLQVT